MFLLKSVANRPKNIYSIQVHAVGTGITQHSWGAVVARGRAVVTSSNACSCSSCCWRISNCLCSSSSCLRIYSWAARQHKEIEIDWEKNLEIWTFIYRQRRKLKTERGEQNRIENIISCGSFQWGEKIIIKDIISSNNFNVLQRENEKKKRLKLSFQKTWEAWRESSRAINIE